MPTQRSGVGIRLERLRGPLPQRGGTSQPRASPESARGVDRSGLIGVRHSDRLRSAGTRERQNSLRAFASWRLCDQRKGAEAQRRKEVGDALSNWQSRVLDDHDVISGPAERRAERSRRSEAKSGFVSSGLGHFLRILNKEQIVLGLRPCNLPTPFIHPHPPGD